MILNHLNLTVTDVTAAKEFCKPISDSKLEASVASRLRLFDDQGMVLTLMRVPRLTIPRRFISALYRKAKQR